MFIIYFWERGKDRARAGEGQRERETQNLKQAPGCQHRARRWARTHGLQDHDLSRSQMLNQLSHPGAPYLHFLKPSRRFWRAATLRSRVPQVPHSDWLERGRQSIMDKAETPSQDSLSSTVHCCVPAVSPQLLTHGSADRKCKLQGSHWQRTVRVRQTGLSHI